MGLPDKRKREKARRDGRAFGVLRSPLMDQKWYAMPIAGALML
jgi:hypothetical protein